MLEFTMERSLGAEEVSAIKEALILGSILRRHGVSFYFYADDTQIYLPIKRKDPSAFTSLLKCLEEVKLWLGQNLLSLNKNKTEVIVSGPSDNS